MRSISTEVFGFFLYPSAYCLSFFRVSLELISFGSPLNIFCFFALTSINSSSSKKNAFNMIPKINQHHNHTPLKSCNDFSYRSSLNYYTWANRNVNDSPEFSRRQLSSFGMHTKFKRGEPRLVKIWTKVGCDLKQTKIPFFNSWLSLPSSSCFSLYLSLSASHLLTPSTVA